MTIKECIDIVDNIKPNQYTVKEKVGWLSFIDEIIINDVLKTHEGYDGRYDDFEGYSEDKLSVSLIVPSPYDRLYTAYLKMKIDGENGEMARYNNSAELFNTYMMEYRKHYNKTHMPLDVTRKDSIPKPKQSVGTLPESVIENITRELYAMLSEDVAEQTSEDRIYSIVTSYMQNNAEMLKGKDGKTPEKGIDYVDGVDGVGVASIKQTVTSAEDGGTNTLLVTMTDGSTYRFYVRNGSKGDKPVVGVDYYTPEEKEELKAEIFNEIDVSGKEDKSNKRADAEFILDFHNHNDYPTTRAVHDYVEGEKTQILRKVDWELIETVTLTQDVQRVYCNIVHFYKELYIRFTIPTMNPDNTSGFQKARSFVYANGNTSAFSVYDDGDYRYEDTGKSWILTHHLTMIGNICTCERRILNVQNGPYQATWGTTIGKVLNENYIDSLNVLMYPNGTRLFPAGTTYELWGVRA